MIMLVIQLELLVLDIPDKKSKDDNTSKQIEYDEEYAVPLSSIFFRLLVPPHDRHCGRHDIDPAFQRDDFEENEHRLAEGVK